MTRFHSQTPVRSACLVLVAALAGCSSVSDLMSGDKIDYKSQGAKTSTLEIPPDLTAISRDPRYQAPASGTTVSAATFNPGAAVSPGAIPAAAGTEAVAPKSVGDLKIVREGNQRWLSTNIPPEQLWPDLQSFWQERGFTLEVDDATTGVM
ncbi:MAG: hypothetical protein JWP52_3095, partial [Rhizobacter sp.]|nr:hypothetical protein [Rhizobacter sp.]